jgi:hypothetical protein
MRTASPLSLLALLAFTAPAGCDPDPSSPLRPPEAAALEAGLRVVDHPLPGALLGVGGAGDDVWFVGGGESGTVFHLDLRAMRPEVIPAGPRLWWVAATGEPGGAVAGGEGGRILRRVAGAWVADAVVVGDGGPEEAELIDKAVIWGTFVVAPGDWWAVGGSVRRGGPKGLVLRSSGDGHWRRVRDAALPELNLYKVWGAAADDLWIVGEGRVVLHFDGARFTRHDVGERDLLFTVHGAMPSTSDDAAPVAVGTGSEGGLLFRYDPAAARWRDVAPAGTPNLNGVFVRPDGLVTVVGERGAVLLGDRAGRWHRLDLIAADAIGARTLHAVYQSPDGTTWAVGGDLTAGTDGLILTTRPTDPPLEMP